MNKVSLVFLSVASTILPSVAFAQEVVAVPGPLAGAGLPALAVAGGALWLVRKFSNRQR